MFHTPILQEEICKLDEWANKWEMNFNVDKCSVMQIGHNNMQDKRHVQSSVAVNRSTARSKSHHHQRPQVGKTNREGKAAK